MMEKKNLKFSYLYRDSGNYKTYGEIILANPNAISPEDATIELGKRLIDQEFFYPEEVGVPLLLGENLHDFRPWYEFIEFSLVDEKDDGVAVQEFMERFKTYLI